MAFSISALQVNGSIYDSTRQFQTALSTSFKYGSDDDLLFVDCDQPLLHFLPKKIDLAKMMKQTGGRLLDAFVNTTFRIVDQPLHTFQRNLMPVEEIEETTEITCIDGKIPLDFAEGVYVRNGPNPLHGCLKSSISILGKTSQVWIEGEGMLHATYFEKDPLGNWIIRYKNKYVESETFKIEKQRNQILFIPSLEGDPLAVLTANFVNKLRLGTASKHYQNVNVFEHSGKVYTASENAPPQEFDVSTLQSFNYWDLDDCWSTRPFCSHPKKAPVTGELVTMSIDAEKPYFLVGVISADDGKMLHSVDLKLNRAVLSHDIGVTNKYNVLIDHPLVLDLPGLIKGGSLLKYDKEGYARFGVMPRYGDVDSVKWFDVEPHCTFHLFNCFEDGNEVVVRGCRCRESVIPGPEYGTDKFEWFSRGYNFTETNNRDNMGEFGFLFHHVYEWRLNMTTGEVKEKRLTGTDLSMDFPFINNEFTGLKNKYGYTQVLDSKASSASGLSKYGGLAKLCFDTENSTQSGDQSEQQKIKFEYHMFGDDIFCTGSVFVAKPGGVEEDDGWIITYVHNEETNISQAYIVDAKNFSSKAVATVNLPQRVPYGHHGIFVSIPNQVS